MQISLRLATSLCTPILVQLAKVVSAAMAASVAKIQETVKKALALAKRVSSK